VSSLANAIHPPFCPTITTSKCGILQREIMGESRTSQGVGTRTTFQEGCWDLFWRLFSLPSGIRNRKKDQMVGERRASRFPLAIIFRAVGAPNVYLQFCAKHKARKFLRQQRSFSRKLGSFQMRLGSFRQSLTCFARNVLCLSPNVM
jgi:hypothetical protein